MINAEQCPLMFVCLSQIFINTTDLKLSQGSPMCTLKDDASFLSKYYAGKLLLGIIGNEDCNRQMSCRS